MLISFFTAFLGFALLPLIPLKDDIEKSQNKRGIDEYKETKQRLERRE